MGKKCFSEVLGTAILVLFGCGAAMLYGADIPATQLIVALSFGLGLIVAAYTVGEISGAHLNPAVSIGMYMSGRMSFKECVQYILSQCIGAILGTSILAIIFNLDAYDMLADQTNSFALTDLAQSNYTSGICAELFLTFFFVLLVLAITNPNRPEKKFAPVIIGLGLTTVHIIGIPITGTSVNPARTLGSAVFACIKNQGDPEVLKDIIPMFVIAIFAAALATLIYKMIIDNTPKNEKIEALEEKENKEENQEQIKETLPETPAETTETSKVDTSLEDPEEL